MNKNSGQWSVVSGQLKRRVRRTTLFILLASMSLALPVNFHAAPLSPIQPNIDINGQFSTARAQRGRILRASVVIDIPSGFHINSNRPLAKFLIPTSLKIEAPASVRVGTVSFPPARLRSFSFSQDKLSVYEGHVVLRFNVTVPQNFSGSELNLRAHLRYQSCNDESCFPPVTREVPMSIAVG
jgi:DsbC/DsbD-like thiol-disulfide interchange protein